MRHLRRFSHPFLVAFYSLSRACVKARVPASSKLILGNRVIFGGKVTIGSKSVLLIEENVRVLGRLFVGEGCNVTIRKDSYLENVTIRIDNNSTVEFGEGTVMDSPSRFPNFIHVENGVLQLAARTHIQADVLVRFGGILTIGMYSGIGYLSEIRCEKRINIGEYCMVSYGVCIYDTNTHSTDWRERRRRIEKGYPIGAGEEYAPITKEIVIGNDVWIGKEATILKGCVIGDRCIIGTRTVVGARSIPSDSLIVANEPRVIHRHS